MCFDFSTMLKNKEEYIEPFEEGLNTLELEHLKKSLDDTFEDIGKKYYHTNGFSHDPLPIVVLDDDSRLTYKVAHWGLIPSWAKEPDMVERMRKQTINARGETIFKKPAFRKAAYNTRAIIPMDGFFEHHHYGKGSIVPYYITPAQGIFLGGGLYNNWVDKETGEEIMTFSLVTCQANEFMGKIHNNPKAKEPRMPLLFSPRKAKIWLDPEKEVDDLIFMVLPYETEMKSKPVHKIRGGAYLGNNHEVQTRSNFPGAPDFGDYKPQDLLF